MKLRGAQGGVSLVEIMAAIFNFMIGLMALLSVYTQTAWAGKRAESAYTAYNLAKSHVDTLKAVSFNSLPKATETSVFLDADGNTDPAGGFIRSTTVSINYLGNPNLTQITVSVSYVLQGVQSQSPMQIETVIFNGT